MPDDAQDNNATPTTDSPLGDPPSSPPDTPPSAPPAPNPEDIVDSHLVYDTPEWIRRNEEWDGALARLRSDLVRISRIESMPRSRRGAMMRSLLHSAMTRINNEIRLATDGKTATKIFDRFDERA
jgi:hypothetical protein